MNGRRLSWYEVTGPLGRGGMGEVWRARDTRLERDVAIKMLPADVAADAERAARFEREAKLLAALNHPCIGQIYGFEEADGERFLVLELVGGETLAERLDREGALPVEDALRIAKQVAAALEAAHADGIIHRDLKPGNV
ncbi:MAG: serine/threonine protein kinase, partial [Phycisphaerales bacterium]|nr:serine/threonine protein kinase [Phycisphaerales bacterium]